MKLSLTKSLFSLFGLITLTVASLGPTPAQAASATKTPAALQGASAGSAAPVDQMIIKYKASSDGYMHPSGAGELSALSQAAGVSLQYKRAMSGNAHVVKLPQKMSLDAAQAIADKLVSSGQVEYAEPDRIMTIVGTPTALPSGPASRPAQLDPNDPLYTLQWDFYDTWGIDAPAAWDITTGSDSVVVADIDTGITNHAEFMGRVVPGYDFISDSTYSNDGDGRDSNPSDPGDWVAAGECGNGNPAENSSWHGTHTAGTIGATGNNGQGVSGINWNSKILPVRVLGKCGGTMSDVIDGMTWSAGLVVPGVPTNANPAKVLNLSLGGYGSCSASIQNAIDAITTAGSVVVVAAGNNSMDASNFTPGNCNNVITVTATDRTGNMAYYSNYGSLVEISAPGGAQSYANDPNGILSTLNTGTYGPADDTYIFYQGTSMATPHVTGVVSLMFSVNPGLTPAQVLQILQSTAKAFPTGGSCNTSNCGSGIVDAGAAVAIAAGGPLPPTSTATATRTVTPTPTNTATPTTTATQVPGCNSQTVTINDKSTASPYPSDVTVSGLGTFITDVNVKLFGFTHAWPEDVDALLVGPQGQNLMLMSDAGGGDPGVSNANLTFDDAASQPLPYGAGFSSGTYQPINYEGTENLPAPAPATSSATTLSTFNGTNPNGTWSLYVVDDAAGYSGVISGGWCLNITTSSDPTATVTPTLTSTLTPTITPTGMPTLTPTLSRTVTNTPTATNTFTPTPVQVSTVQYADLVVDEARGRLYGADQAGSKIDVIDMSSMTVTSSYLLANGALPTGLALSPDGSELAVAQSALSQVEFINLTDGSMSQLAAPLSGSSTKAFDVVYGRVGILYVLSNNRIHVIDLTQSPHAENTTQYLLYSSDEKYGTISSDKNTLYYVTGTCCSGYNSLHKIDVSGAQPVESGYTILSGSGYQTGIKLALIDDNTLVTSFRTVYNTSNLTPIAKKTQWMLPFAILPNHSFYAVVDSSTNPDQLLFFNNNSSYQVSALSTGKNGTPGAMAVTSDGSTLYVSSTAGMTKFSIGSTPPGIAVGLPASNHVYRDLAIDTTRSRVYGTDSSDRIDVMDLQTLAVLNSYLLPAGANPIGIDLSPDGSELAIALNGLEAILFMNPVTGAEIARVTPKLDISGYYINQPYDVIYGRSGRLYSDGNPGSSGTDYIHTIDTTTHTWLKKSIYPNTFSSGAELAISADMNTLYANETFSPNNIYVVNVQTDTPAVIAKGPHGPVSANKFTIMPDRSKVFTTGAQVWSGDMQTSLGTLEGGSSKLIEYLPNLNAVVEAVTASGGDVLKFVRATDYRLFYTMHPVTGGTILEMESSSDGRYLVVNTSNGIEVIDTTALKIPAVSSIVRRSVNPHLEGSSVGFTVTFSTAVTGVDASDFVLTSNGLTGASIISVSGSGATYTVNANTGTGYGTLRLDLVDNNSITDTMGNMLGGPGLGDGTYTSGESYLIYSLTPTATLTPTPTSTTTLTPTVTPTLAPTLTATPTMTATLTPSETATITPTSSMTATVTSTTTFTPTITSSPTASLTPTETATFTPTVTATMMVTPTQTPTQTRTPTTGKVTYTSIGAQDGWVLESAETSNVGGSVNSSLTDFRLGDDATRKQYRAILSFNTASLPDNATITSVLLKVKKETISGSGNPLAIFHGFLADIKNGFFGSAPALQAADFQAAGNGTLGPFSPAPLNNVYTINLTNGLAFINKLAIHNGLTQIRLRFKLDDNNDAIANYLILYSGNASALANRPQLVITYSVP